MGAGASTSYDPDILMELVVQQDKPLDASDVSIIVLKSLVATDAPHYENILKQINVLN